MNQINWHKIKNGIRILLNAVIFAGMLYAGIGLYQSYSNKKAQEQLKILTETSIIESGEQQPKEEPSKEGGADAKDMFLEEETEEQPQILPEYTTLYEQNHNLAGWLTIEGTMIDYPVMRGEDDEYYLNHDFEGNESKYGCLFVKSFVDVDAHGTNFVIYGHHMKDGSMFGQLKKYKEEDFYSKHPDIIFHSLYEKRTYEIAAVFFSQVYPVEYDGFKYYEFYQADTEEEFLYFCDNIKELSLYDTGVDAQFGDRFITLSTCEYHVEDGRFVIVAKEK